MPPDSTTPLAHPWGAFLRELNEQLPEKVELHCLGGFVLTVLYGRTIETHDVDYVAVVPHRASSTLERIAGRDSVLARRHRVWLQFVTVAEVPEAYESRLKEIHPGEFSKIRLLALDPHDIALSKLTRNHPIDRRDVAFLAEKGILDAAVLEKRYRRELRPYLANEERHDLTLKLWLEDYFSR